jgi:hypothetical protein
MVASTQEGAEISVERFQELMHVENVIHGDRLG